MTFSVDNLPSKTGINEHKVAPTCGLLHFAQQGPAAYTMNGCWDPHEGLYRGHLEKSTKFQIAQYPSIREGALQENIYIYMA